MARLHVCVVTTVFGLVCGSVTPSAQSAPGGPPTDAIVVARFANISGAAEDDWFGQGIVETLMTDLEHVASVSTVDDQTATGAANTVNTGRDSNSQAIALATGRRLGAQWVVDGAYQRLRNRVRITARVVDVETARVVHTTVIDGAVTELPGGVHLQRRPVCDRGGPPAGR